MEVRSLHQIKIIFSIGVILLLFAYKVESVKCFRCHGTSVSAVTSSCWDEVNDEHARFVALEDCEHTCTITTLNHTTIGLVDYTRSCEEACVPGCYNTPFGTTLCKYCCDTDKCNALIPSRVAKTYEKLDNASTSNLGTWLTDHFAKPRHHAANPSHKFHTRHELTKLLSSFGCEFEKQNFTVPEIHQEESAPKNFRLFVRTTTKGYNLICEFRGRYYGTERDRITVVMAHYDTDDSGSPGVDENGSGSVALLEAARLVGHHGCDRDNTIIFVMTDYEEHGIFESSLASDEECSEPPPYVHKVGSLTFVCNWLLPHLKNNNGQLLTTINLHSIMNTFNSNSSPWPKHIQNLMKVTESTRKLLKTVRKKAFSGDWLLAKHAEVPENVINVLNYNWEKQNAEELDLLNMEIPINLPEEHSLKTEFLYNDDCAAFFDKRTTMPCLTLTDTGILRGYMRRCYHEKCDDITHVGKEALVNLAKIVSALYYTIEDLSNSDCVKKLATTPTLTSTVLPNVEVYTDSSAKCNFPLLRDELNFKESDPEVTALCAVKSNSGIRCITNRQIWGMINSDTAWIPPINTDYRPLWYCEGFTSLDSMPRYEVDFRKVKRITSMAIQGIPRNGYVKSFMFAYGTQRDIETWTWYQRFSSDVSSSIIEGNKNYRKKSVTSFEPNIAAQYVRLYPYKWKRRVALQVQFYGC